MTKQKVTIKKALKLDPSVDFSEFKPVEMTEAELLALVKKGLSKDKK